MKIKAIISFVFVALVSASFVSGPRADAKQGQMLGMLPASDGVVTVDVRRLLDEALPQILAANEPMLTKVNFEVDKIKAKTGLDLRRFDSLAIGFKTKQISATELDLQPILLARGPAEAASLSEAAKMASDGETRTEMIAGRTVHIFTAQQIVDKNKSAGKDSGGFFDKIVDKLVGSLSGEVALVAFDENTVALGSLTRVRELLGDGPRVSQNIISMMSVERDPVGSFAMVVPDGLSRYLELEEDDLGEGLDSVREMNGFLDVIPGKAMISINAKMADPEKAESLEIMLQGFQGVLSSILKRQQGADKKVYGRMLENLDVSRKNDRLQLKLDIPQKDIDVIVGKK